jgi:alpha-N-acetylglucosamine transferase
MSKGILLIAYGKHYGKFAYNLATSIKKLSDVKIHLVCDEDAIKDTPMMFFDSYEVYDFPKENGRIDPCRTKVDIIKMTPFYKTMYLDVDAVCLNDITPLFDELNGQDIYTHIKKVDSNWIRSLYKGYRIFNNSA